MQPPPPPAPPPPPPPPPPAPPACELSVVGQDGEALSQLEVGEGARVDLALQMSEGGTAELQSFPEGWKVTLTGPNTLRIKPAYGSDAGTVRLGVLCDESDGEQELSVSVRKLGWSEVTPWSAGTDGPNGREYFSMWIDSGDPDRLLLYGGFHYRPQQFTPAADLWSLDLRTETWTELNTAGTGPVLAGGGLVKVPGRQRALYLGGLGRNGDNFLLPFSLAHLDYSGAQPEWVTLTPTGAPGAGVYQPAFVYDAPRDRYISACGMGANGVHCDVSVYDLSSNAFSQIQAEGTPPSGRMGFFWVHDEERERIIIFSGDQGGGAGGACNCAHDTWALELGNGVPRWVQLGAPPPEIGRRNGAYVIDPVGHRMFVWGGTPDGRSVSPGLWAFDLDDDDGWVRVETESTPPIRASGGATFDAARNRLLMGFGNDSVFGSHEDLWALQL